ncbi:MAG: glutathione S-transferase [Chromatiales bacterium]|jgi:glutathione S-transferase|nr:glutathione S-transferase [Chromatiales bacterium]
MQILTDAATPFGRKTMVAALEKQISVTESFVPIDATLDSANPLRQIPVLVMDKGESLYDSDVILLYLDELHTSAPLFPADRRFEVLTRLALANGMIESVLLRTMESRRVDGERSDAFIEKLGDRTLRGVVQLERGVSQLSTDTLNAGDIAVVCALEYADFRFTRDWRSQAPKLAAWHATISERSSFANTRPTRTQPVSAT